MRQAITTKFIGPTKTRPSRYKATSASGHTFTMSADYSQGLEGNHKLAAMILAKKLGWTGTWHGGSTENGYCFVIENETADTFVVTGTEPAGVFHGNEYAVLPAHLKNK